MMSELFPVRMALTQLFKMFSTFCNTSSTAFITAESREVLTVICQPGKYIVGKLMNIDPIVFSFSIYLSSFIYLSKSYTGLCVNMEYFYFL